MIKVAEIENNNETAIQSYLEKEYPIKCLNEYFFINEESIINDLLKKIENRSEKENMIFLTNFFWDNSNDDYAIYENIGKLLLRVSSYNDENTRIEIKKLDKEEQINLIKNLDIIVSSNNELKKLFKLEDEKLTEKIIKIINKKDSIEKIKDLYCGDWLDENIIDEVVEYGKKFLNAIALNEKLSNLDTKKNIKKHKI